DTVYLERYVRNPRHIEIQVICDSHGNAAHLGERECSIQRRHQKIMEETPSPALTAAIRAAMGDAAIRAAKAAGYANAGTVEFIFSDGDFYFLEVNARLQVEHPITEAVTGIDLVKEQLRVAAGLPLAFVQEDVEWRGHAIEMRINAENPAKSFIPNPKRIQRWVGPSGPGVRLDSGFGPGSDVPPNYDSLVAKLIVHGADRAEAIARAGRALREFVVVGPATTIPYHRAILDSPDFRAGKLSTRFIDDHPELVAQAKVLASEQSPFDYGPDPRHIAAAAAAVSAVIQQGRGGRVVAHPKVGRPFDVIGSMQQGPAGGVRAPRPARRDRAGLVFLQRAGRRRRVGDPRRRGQSLPGRGHHRGRAEPGDLRAGHGGDATVTPRRAERGPRRRDRRFGLGDGARPRGEVAPAGLRRL